jgi:hypothetical protein
MTMRLLDIQKLLAAEVIWGKNELEIEIESALASDLMSDVLSLGEPVHLFLTGLANSQSVRTADIIDARAIVYVRGKKPDKEGLELAMKKGIPVLSTPFLMYKACGILYKNGLPAIAIPERK